MFKKSIRFLQIQYILAKYGIDDILFSTRWLSGFKFMACFNPWYWSTRRQLSKAVRLRLALETLGPIFIKFGQALSTRRDLLPKAYANELALLQDKVPPFSQQQANQCLQQIYGDELTSLFADIDLQALASASIAQVHAAHLADGRAVVIKLLRPGIEKTIRRDIDLLYSLARFITRVLPSAKHIRPLDIVAEFEKTLLSELDMQREAANASQLRRNFQSSSLIYIPEVYWPYVRPHALVMERIHGVGIANKIALQQAGFDLQQVAERLIEMLFTQVFRDCFFHADLHPGNIFLDEHSQKNPRFILVDLGIVGSLNSADQRYIADNFLAFFHRNYRRVAELHIESGWLDYDTNVQDFEAAIRTVSEPLFDKPLHEISMGTVLLQLFATAKTFKINIQPQLILLQKTLLNVEGLARDLSPELDLWQVAKPFLDKWIKQQVGLRPALKKIHERAPYWLEKLPEIPDLIYYNLQHVFHKRQITKQQVKTPAEKKSHPLGAMMLGMVFGVLSSVLTYYLWFK